MASVNLPGVQWTPSNHDQGYGFLDDNCRHCARDKAMSTGADYEDCDDNELCPIIAKSFRGEALEWREMPDGEIKCIAFVPAGQPIPPPRCEHTRELFDDSQLPVTPNSK